MAEFATIDNNSPNIPFPTTNTDGNALGLTIPGSILTGTMAGQQMLGSSTLTLDSVNNLITVKPIATTGTKILRYGQVATGYLGMAVNDGTNDTMFAGQDNSGNTVVKIAKSGFDAKTASAANLIFNSGQDTFKIISVVTIPLSFTLNASGASFGLIKQAHGFTFTPAYLAFITIDPVLADLSDAGTTNVPNPFTIFGISGSTLIPELSAYVSVDSTNINFEIITRVVGNSSLDNSAKIYLLQETAN